MISISVIITTKNRINLLNHAIQSVQGQTLSPKEIIVINDGGEKYSPPNKTKIQIRVFNLTHSYGANYCRNLGVKEATGNYISFLDDDDFWADEKLEKQARLCSTTQNTLELIYTGRRVEYFKNDLMVSSRNTFRNIPQNPLSSLSKSNFIGSTSSILISKKALEKVGGFKIGLESMQDYELYIRLAKAKIIFKAIPESLVHYRVEVHSKSISKGSLRNLRSSLKILSSFDDINHKAVFFMSGVILNTLKTFYKVSFEKFL